MVYLKHKRKRGMKMKVKAYAKINLMLDITGKKENGYHTLFMLMQSVSLYDTVSVEVSGGEGITLTCATPGVPCDERNTAYKAAAAFLKKAGMKKRVEIGLEKNIPHEAGLAGGSADAAAVIYALNEILRPGFTERELTEICLQVGSDVPFCLKGGTCVVQHVGDVISPVPNISEKDLVVVLCKPESGVSTAGAYRQVDEAEHIRHLDREGMLCAAADGNTEEICRLCDNVFEQVIDVPERAGIKTVMRKNGCLCCCMSGSGPTVYGVFDKMENAEICAQELEEKYGSAFVCLTVPRGVSM